MATQPQQGIMALPENDQMNAPQLSLNESYDAAKAGMQEADPQLGEMYNAEMAKAMPELLKLSDEQLDALLQLIQYLRDHPEEYTQRVQELEADGTLEKDTLPAEYDETFLSVFGAAVLQAQQNNEPATPTEQTMQPPMAMARGGIAEAARMVANQGRSGDTMLAHITKDEAKMLKKRGGVGTINPRTGLPEYGLWSSIKSVVSAPVKAVSSAVKAVGGVVKQVLASPIGRIAATVALATFIGPAAFGLTGAAGVAAQFGLASAGISALGGGNLKDIVRSGVTGAIAGYGGATLGPALGGTTGVTSAAGQAALGAGATGAGIGLLSGKSIKDSVKDGLASAAIAGAMTYAAQPSGNQPTDSTGQPTTPQNASKVSVDPVTGQVTTGQSTAPAQPDWLKQWQAEGQNMSVPGPNVAQNMSMPGQQPTAPVASTEPTWWDKTKEFLSPTSRAEAGANDAMKSVMDKYGVTQEQVLNAPANSILGKAYSAATPGFMSNYGPALATGLGITALTGGFKAEQPTMSQASQDMVSGKATQDIINANPKNYITQNLPGVTYDTKGNIVSSGPWTPRSGAGTTEVAGDYIPYSTTYTPPPAPVYSTPIGSMGGANRQIAQPYNTAAMYDFRAPRRAAQGGMMETQGAFPANPLTMPSSPMMAMDSHSLPMNTPGVPMNRPMGYAMGGAPVGIATLAPGGYPRRNGQISGPGTETSDDIPAMLSDGEFVMTAKAVRGLGKGNRREGAKKMYALMHRLEKNAARG